MASQLPSSWTHVPSQFKGLFSILSYSHFPKRVISQGKALQPFLGMWEGKIIMVVQLKAKKTHSEKKTDSIIKTVYIYIYT